MTTSAKGTVERPGKDVRQKAGLNREILEVSPGMMISMLRYKGRWLVRGHRREEHLAGMLAMRPHGREGPVDPKDARIARWRSTATSTWRGTS
jgi:hypothetical protein